MDIFTNPVIVHTAVRRCCWGWARSVHPQQPNLTARRLEAALQPVTFLGSSPWISMGRKADFIHNKPEQLSELLVHIDKIGQL